MADINLDPQATTAAGRRLDECGGELLSARSTTGANLDSMNSAHPWGRDELGEVFARRYEQAAIRTLENWRKAAESFSDLGSRVQGATADSLEPDRVTSEAIDKIA